MGSIAQAQDFHDVGRNWDRDRFVYKLGSRHAIWNDTAVDETIFDIARKIEAANGLPAHLVFVELVACAVANSEIRPGGWVTICLQIVDAAKTEDELAFVIAHEMSHILLGHLDNAAPNRRIVRDPRSELDADLLGLELASNAGYASSGAVRFFNLLFDLAIETDQLNEAGIIDWRRERVMAGIQNLAPEVGLLSETPVSREYKVAARGIRAFRKEIEEVFEEMADGTLPVLGESGAIADRQRQATCLSGYDRLNFLAKASGLSDPIVHAGIALYSRCFPLTGVADAYFNLLTKHGSFEGISTNSIAGIASAFRLVMGYNLAKPVFEAFRAHVLNLPTYIEDLPIERRSEAVRSVTLSKVWNLCYILGALGYGERIGYQELRASIGPDAIAIVEERVGVVVSTMRLGCDDSFDRGASILNFHRKRSIDSRIRWSGFDPEQASNWAEHEARAIIGASLVSDGDWWLSVTSR